MSALELKIDRLHVNISVASGHEHRISPIVSRAAAMAAEQIAGQVNTRRRNMPASGRVDTVTANPVGVDIAQTSDDHAAREIAASLVEALALKLGI